MPKTNKDCVVAFRLTEAHAERLASEMSAAHVLGVRSSHQLARKVVMDFLEGRLKYANVADKQRDPSRSISPSLQAGALKAA